MACARHAGLSLPASAKEAYGRRFEAAFPEFLEMNLTGNPVRAREFYAKLGAAWLEELGVDGRLVDRVLNAADELAYGPSSILFKPFEDAIPCLTEVRN